MKHHLFSRQRHRLGIAGIVAIVVGCGAVLPAAAAASTVDTSGCSNPSLSQPFLAWGDANWYTLLPGESHDMFAGDGWTLTGGASVKTATLADGSTGQVLDLPSGSRAVSPVVCVTTSYPTARSEVRNVIGGEGVQFYVSYAGTATWDTPKNTGQLHGGNGTWALSTPINLQPSGSGWQLVRFTFVPGGKASDFQLYDFWVDPRCR
jgi:hypothetical protein